MLRGCRRFTPCDKMQILSHRGFHLGAAGIHENTCAAFDRAIHAGVDGIETDIRLSADGVPVLFHDRVVRGVHPIESLTRRGLQDLLEYEIPSLQEILESWPDLFWNLEVKCPAAVAATIDCVRRHPRPERILVTSFRHDIVQECAARLNVACGLIAAHSPIEVVEFLAPWQATPQVRTIVWDFNVVDAALVEEAQRRGFEVYAYGAITAEEHQLCREWGLSAVITDFPDRCIV